MGGYDTYTEFMMIARLMGLRAAECGLNADWSVRAACVSPHGRPNIDDGLLYVVDHEDAQGSIGLVRRLWNDDDGCYEMHGIEDFWDATEAILAVAREVRNG